jgi:hypothetical protein
MRLTSLLVIFLTILGCNKSKYTNKYTNPAPAPNHTTTSTVTVGRDGDLQFPVVDNGRFYVVPEYRVDDQKTVTLALEEHTVTQIRTDQECCSAEIIVKGTINDKPTWTLRKKASDAEMFGRFYRTITQGCCGSATRYSYFDPLTGNRSYMATEPIASLNVVGRYELSRYLVLNRISEHGDDKFVLQIQYGPQSGPTQIAFLSCPGQDIAPLRTTVEYLRNGKIEGSTMSGQSGIFPIDFTLFPPGYPSNTDAKSDDISAFSFVLKIEGQQPIRIPVVKDHLDFGSVVLPKDFHISEAVPTDYAAYLEEMRK